MAARREFDLVVYGATGFTGRLVAAYLARTAPAGVRWALGGRDRRRLEALREELAATYAAAKSAGIVVGAGDTARDVAAATKVVVTTAGPYALHGEPMLAACVAAGTDYVDLCGETFWVSRMIDKHDDAARASGAIIVPMGGFDSVPADLGTFFVASHVRRAHGLRVKEVTAFMHGTGGVSGGTVRARRGGIRALLGVGRRGSGWGSS
jgi:short subunit dehydrogenase-like uncharacterized protein